MLKEPFIGAASRRSFLRNTLILSTAATTARSLPVIASAAPYSSTVSRNVRRLRLVNNNTWERLEVDYWVEGHYIAESLLQINHLMRDHHADQQKNIDPNLLDFMYRLHLRVGASSDIHVLSGYRTPQTNENLRKVISYTAKKSLHMQGKAVDLIIPGFTADTLQRAARQLVSGGVGYYPTAGFVHLDTGYARHWRYT